MVYDEKQITNNGTDLDTSCEVATNNFYQDTPSVVAIDQCNTDDNRIIDSSMPSTDPISLVSRQPEFETKLVRRLSRQVRLPSKLKDFEVFINCGKVKYPLFCWSLLYNLNKHVEPKNMLEALQNPSWKQAIDLEMKASIDNDTRSLSELPTGRKLVGCKWVFRVKYKPNDTVERYKAKLVAKGYS